MSIFGGRTMPESDDGVGCRKREPRYVVCSFFGEIQLQYLIHPFLVSQACATSLTCPKFSAQRRESSSRRIGPCLLLCQVRPGQRGESAIRTRCVCPVFPKKGQYSRHECFKERLIDEKTQFEKMGELILKTILREYGIQSSYIVKGTEEGYYSNIQKGFKMFYKCLNMLKRF